MNVAENNGSASPNSPKKSILKISLGPASPINKQKPNGKSNFESLSPSKGLAGQRISFRPDLFQIKEVESYKKYNQDNVEKVGCCGTNKCLIQ